MSEFFPLPVPHIERTDPLQFIPEVPDPTSSGERMWRALAAQMMTQGATAGKRFAEVALPWQEKFVRAAFAEREDGAPVFTTALLVIAKKNGKSEMSGKLITANAICNPSSRGHAICVAATDKQAQYVYDSMASSIEVDPVLGARFNVRRYKSDIQDLKTNALLRTAPPEAKNLVGAQCAFYVVDELHVLGSNPKAGPIVRQLDAGTKIFSKGRGVMITTAPIGISAGVYQSMMARARRILSGEEPHNGMLPVLFELPEEVWEDLDNHQHLFWMPNPSLGATISKDWLMAEYSSAMKDPDPERKRDFLSQHLNIPAAEIIGIDRWLPLATWDKYADPSLTLDAVIRRSVNIWVGLDAGLMDDPTAMVVLGMTGDGEYLAWSMQWLHRDGYEKRIGQIPYDNYIAAGELTIVDVAGADLVDVFDFVVTKLAPTGKLKSVLVDEHKLATLIEDLERQGVRVMAVPQGWRLTKYIILSDRIIHEGKLRHGGQPLLRFNVENAQLAERGRGLSIVKPGDIGGARKIDGVICLIMALAGTIDDPPGASEIFTL